MTQETHSSVILGGAESIAEWRRHNGDQPLIAPNATLVEARLDGADLSRSQLVGANLAGASLRGANLAHADLRGTNLDGADLCYAQLCHANLLGASMVRADLESADLTDAVLLGVKAEQLHARATDLEKAYFSRSLCCVVCLRRTQVSQSSGSIDADVDIGCPHCGVYHVSWPLFLLQSRHSRRDLRALAPWIRQRSEEGSAPPRLDEHNMKDRIELLPKFRPGEKMNLLLRAIERRTAHPGAAVDLNWDTDSTLAWSAESTEAKFYLNSLVERGYLSNITRTEPTITDQLNENERAFVSITAKGFDYLDMHDRSSTLTYQVFVAMPFSKDMLHLYTDGFCPAIIAAGYTPYRVDFEAHTEAIDARITNSIRESRFVIADATGGRPNVYYEAGFAQGLGKPLIWTVNEAEKDNIPFDTRQYPHVVWSEVDKLAKDLAALIIAIVGKGIPPESPRGLRGL
jgi:hypothetical protein